MITEDDAYRMLEDKPEVEFEYALAHQLGMTHSQLIQSIESSDELTTWKAYFDRQKQREELTRRTHQL